MRIHRVARYALFIAALASGSAHASAGSDVRILIDVSGSMQKTDPSNLRVPALRLLAELLPAGTTAGVWLFDQGVTRLLAPGVVDENWKNAARDQAAKVHSRGLFTNIEAALKAASADWHAVPLPAGAGRHIVLLTDGVVDVSDDAQASDASRKRLLDEVLEELRQKSVHVHTVALSKGVDAELLATLSAATGGWREDAPTAAALQRAFLHMFEQATPPDTVPLQGRKFAVDDSVHEFTLLVFHDADAPPLILTGPDQLILSAAEPGPDSRWESEAGYHLVTVASPAAGEWSFSGKEDPDNRAIIVTDVTLELDGLPAGALPGETLPLAARLLERGRPIEREDFLALTRMNAAILGTGGNGDLLELPFDPVARDFRGSLGTTLPPGAYELVVRASGGTFEREVRRRLRIEDTPVSMTATAIEGKDGSRISVALSANADLVEPASITGYVLATGRDGTRLVQELPALADGAVTIELPLTDGGDYLVAATLIATTGNGRAMRLQLAPQKLSVASQPRLPPVAAPEPVTVAPPEKDFAEAATIVGIGNLGLGALLGPMWFVMRRREPPSIGMSP
jgi:uncharacterized protein (TIGR03503 family)